MINGSARSVLLTQCLGLSLVASIAFGQNVNDLTGHDVSAQQLINVLTPKESQLPPAGAPSRGLGLVSPNCKHFHIAANRGIKLVPKADIAAITVEFPSGSAELTPADEKILTSLGRALDSTTLKPCCFEIQGHTDAVGSAVFNKRLSEKRAQAVVDYLAQQNTVDRDRMLARGLGKSQPIASNETAEGRAKNRRVQIVNLGYGTTSAQ
jgi:outer membrane protein OmpA-like peptidoglycan-associated protein